MKESKIITLVLLGLGVLFSVMYFSTRGVDLPKNQAMPWQSYTNESGNTVVFGLTMRHSTLLDAMSLFGKELEVSLFEEKGKTPSLEVFFPSAKVGGIGAKIVLNLEISPSQVMALKMQIDETEVMPSGVKKTVFQHHTDKDMLGLKINVLTFAPKADLSRATILAHFGQPTKIEKIQAGLEHWYYKNKGLKIVMSDEYKEILEFH
jgi:hypothetical protein